MVPGTVVMCMLNATEWQSGPGPCGRPVKLRKRAEVHNENLVPTLAMRSNAQRASVKTRGLLLALTMKRDSWCVGQARGGSRSRVETSGRQRVMRFVAKTTRARCLRRQG